MGSSYLLDNADPKGAFRLPRRTSLIAPMAAKIAQKPRALQPPLGVWLRVLGYASLRGRGIGAPDEAAPVKISVRPVSLLPFTP